ncbi:MAG TPA: response regulator, partial [Geobacterales bacterium]|nr:response regulator [Geobacterales bacterium]
RDALQSGVPINLVIMDLTIQGGMGGEEAVRELLLLDPSAKVIVSSGYATGPIMANYAKHGFKAAIIKPYQRQELEKAVAQILDQAV